MDRKEGKIIYNSSVLFDRTGKVAGVYNKMYPVLDDPPGVGGEFKGMVNGRPGRDAMVFDTDFGRIGMAICFDAQFPEVWQRLEDKGAQLVLFSSAYSAGQSLGAYAMLHHYYVVSSCWSGECQAYDITGERLLDERKGASRIVLDLDRRIFHNNDSYNYRGQREASQRESGRGDRQVVEPRGLARAAGGAAGRRSARAGKEVRPSRTPRLPQQAAPAGR